MDLSNWQFLSSDKATIDLLVEDFLLVELKAVEQISRLHQAQLLTYMKLAETPIGLLLNFNVLKLKDGIKKYIL